MPIRCHWQSSKPYLLLVVIAAGACRGGSASRPAEAGMTDVEAVPQLQTTEVQRIGSAQSPDTGFSRIAGIAVDREGQIYALDGQDLRIRVFNPSGALVRMIGREGQGPGEFESPPLFGVVGDTIWAYDRENYRLTLFGLGGRVLSTAEVKPLEVPVPTPGWAGTVGPVLMRPDGRFVGDILGLHASRTGATTDSSTLKDPRVLFHADGRRVDTVGWYAAESLPKHVSGYLRIGGQRYGIPAPPNARPARLLLPQGEILVTRAIAADPTMATFSISRRTFSGDTIYHHRFEYRPVEYADAFLDSLAWKWATPAAQPLGAPIPRRSPVVAKALRDAMHFPSYQPPIQGQFVGSDGTLWLRREDRGEATYQWLVVDPDGRARGTTRLPRSTQPGWSRGDDLLAVSVDQLGVPWIVRYRLDHG